MNKTNLPFGILLVQISLFLGALAGFADAQYQGYGNRFQYRPHNQYSQPAYRPSGFQPGYAAPPIVTGNSQLRQPNKSTVDPKNTPTPASIIRYAAKPLRNYRKFPRLPGEFEKQKAVLLSVSDLMYQHNGVLKQIVEKTSEKIPLVILFNDGKQLKSTVELLEAIDGDLSHVSFFNLKLDTIWLRDFGPQLAEGNQDAISIDFYYNGQRPLDDKFPIAWGKLSGAEINKVEWTLQGGNLLSNGKGLSIATSRLFVDNYIGFPDAKPGMDVEFERRKLVVDAFKNDCNINQLIILEPLKPESTKHVDMFATFLAADHVLVAEVDPVRDPINARILNNNANLLKQIKVDGKPLKVDRIQIPVRQDKYWSPYTNVIFANNTILFPSYKSDPPELVRNAARVYQRLIPGVHVDTVDMTTMQKLEGALHCMSNNIFSFAPLPKGILSFKEARAKVHGPNFVANDSSKQAKPKNGSNKSAKTARKNKPELGSKLASKAIAKPKQGSFDSNRKSPTKSTPSNVQPDTQPDDRVGLTVKKNSQLEAVKTYRRQFVDGANRFKVDAYAIGIQQDGVVMIRVDSGQEVLVLYNNLCQEDREWLTNNRDKIVTNGPKVKRFLQNYGLN